MSATLQSPLAAAQRPRSFREGGRREKSSRDTKDPTMVLRCMQQTFGVKTQHRKSGSQEKRGKKPSELTAIDFV